MTTHTLHLGDCLEVLRTMPDASVDACVTDPPYGLSFMGKAWDYDVPGVDVWREVLRVLKPGGHLLAFAGTRTQHRMAVAIEDAGFEIRDMIAWVYGSGFPKSLDVSKAIDAKLTTGRSDSVGLRVRDGREAGTVGTNMEKHRSGRNDNDAGVDAAPLSTDAARQWAGWGTALKPALEPITLARKPLAGTVAANVLEHGTGALNVDGCRVEMGDEYDPTKMQRQQANSGGQITRKGAFDSWKGKEIPTYKPGGRWPANLIHDGSDEVVGLFPETGPAKAAHRGAGKGESNAYGVYGGESTVRGHDDSGGSAARFFKQCGYAEADLTAGTDATVKPWKQPDHSPARDTDAPTQEAEGINPNSGLSTTSSGSLQTGQSPTECRSTTSTETRKTTDSKTFSSLPQQSTSASIPSTSGVDLTATGSANAPAVSNGSRQLQSTSISASKAGCSTDAASPATSPESLPINEPGVKRLYYTAKATRAERQGTSHPTTKPLDLMAYLCRLVTPPGGIVLDPFMGSGTTIKAAIGEGFNAIGIEREPAYFAMAEHRMNGAQLGLSLEPAA